MAAVRATFSRMQLDQGAHWVCVPVDGLPARAEEMPEEDWVCGLRAVWEACPQARRAQRVFVVESRAAQARAAQCVAAAQSGGREAVVVLRGGSCVLVPHGKGMTTVNVRAACAGLSRLCSSDSLLGTQSDRLLQSMVQDISGAEASPHTVLATRACFMPKPCDQ